MSAEVLVVETLHALPRKSSELKRALLEIVPLSRMEEGCLQYDLLEPFSGGGEFLVLMRWSSQEDLKRHENSDHIQKFMNQYAGVLYGDVSLSEWKAVARFD